MALSNKIDPAIAEQALAVWLERKLPSGASNIRAFEARIPQGNGFSNETILFQASWIQGAQPQSARLVARIQPSGPAVHPIYDLNAEWRLLTILRDRTRTPVPKIQWFEPDASVLGGPFMVMERIDGRAPGDNPPYTTSGWVLDLTQQQRALLSTNALKTLVDIHAIDARALGLDFLRRSDFGAPGLDREIGYVEHCYTWAAEGLRVPIIEAGLAWVRANRPREERLGLSWGDARIGNMLFAEDLSVAAVLDWELATIAGAEMDVGWWLYLQRRFTDSMSVTLPSGLLDRDSLVEAYTRQSGYELQHLAFYEVFATLRGSIQMLRVAQLMILAGLVPPTSTIRTSNPPLHLLAELLGVPPPKEQPQTWTRGLQGSTDRDQTT